MVAYFLSRVRKLLLAEKTFSYLREQERETLWEENNASRVSVCTKEKVGIGFLQKLRRLSLRTRTNHDF